MSDKELEELAVQICKIFNQSVGLDIVLSDLPEPNQAAWIEVAKFVDERWQESRNELIGNDGKFQYYLQCTRP